MTTPTHCYLRVSVAGSDPSTVVVRLDVDRCPKTCHNFASLCCAPGNAVRPGRRGLLSPLTATYRGTEFHRVVPGFMVQGGDYEKFDGSGGRSVYGGTFPDENLEGKHDAGGVLSMANRGKDTNGSQFFITLGCALHLDGKHVTFGRVVAGMENIRSMSRVETDGDRPVSMQRILVLDCGSGTGEGGKKGEDGASKALLSTSSCSDSGSLSSDSHPERRRSEREREKGRKQGKSDHHDERSNHRRTKRRRSRSHSCSRRHESSHSSSRKERKKHKRNDLKSHERDEEESSDRRRRKRSRIKDRKPDRSRHARNEKWYFLHQGTRSPCFHTGRCDVSGDNCRLDEWRSYLSLLVCLLLH